MITKNNCCEHSSFMERCLAALKEEGGRITAPRKAVIQCLAEALRPLSATEVFELVERAQTSSGIDKVTVYRIIERFAELGLIHQIGPSGKYIACLHDHNTLHLICQCIQCGTAKEVTVPQKLSTEVRSYIRTVFGALSDTPAEVHGQCHSCVAAAQR